MSKDDTGTERIKIFTVAVYMSTGIQMKRKVLTKTFVMIKNKKKPWVSLVYTKIFQ